MSGSEALLARRPGKPFELAAGAARTPVPRAVAAIAAAAEVMSGTSALAADARQHREPALLVVIEALVERVGGVGQFLEHRAGVGHRGGAAAQALGRIVGRLRTAHRAHAVETKLAELARGGLEGRPVLFLLGAEREAGLERGEARFAECAHVVGIR